MLSILNPDLQKLIRFKLYSLHFLLFYIVIGFLSILFELVVYRSVRGIVPELLAKVLGAGASILFAFIGNVKFNFKIPRPKVLKAFLLFVAISSLSLLLNTVFHQKLEDFGLGYEQSRVLASGSLFYIAYLLHRRFTFREFKKVGVAIYAHGVEDIRTIWEKIQFYSDFIHVDIVDKTFKEDTFDPATYRMETIKAYWPHKEIHCHIMSKTPSTWLEKVLPHVDTVLVHLEVEEDLPALIRTIKAAHRRVGLVLMASTPVEACRPYLPFLDEIMLLTIPNPGKSGQQFDVSSLEKIEEINSWSERNDFTLSVDGGVNGQNVHLLQVDKVVSGSFVLNDSKPIQRIMRLQTSNQFERV